MNATAKERYVIVVKQQGFKGVRYGRIVPLRRATVFNDRTRAYKSLISFIDKTGLKAKLITYAKYVELLAAD